MAQLPQMFDATQITPNEMIAGSLPPSDENGWPVVITDSQLVPTRDNPNSGMLVLTLQITEGEYVGATGAWRLNLYHETSEQARNIAARELSAICHVTGVFQIQESSQLHGKPFRAIVKLQDGEGGQKGYTNIKGCKTLDGLNPGQVAKAGPPAVAAPPAAAPPTAAPPAAPPVAPPAAPAAPAAAPPAAAPSPAPAPAPAAPAPAPAAPAPAGSAPPWQRQ